MNTKNRKIREGVVVSDKMDKSVVVLVNRYFKHKFYHKIVRKGKKFMAHDEKNIAKVGDKVQIKEVRPLSKNKRWSVVEIIGKEKK